MAGTAGRLTVLAAVLLGCLAAAADTPVQALAGRYNERFQNGLVDGSRYWSENIVEIVAVDPRHAYVRFELQFFNGHLCSLAGIAQMRGATLVYREPSDKALDTRCTLTLQRRGAKLSWDDAGGSCHSYCGSRGSFTNGDLPWASKRPIRYLSKLKASPEYKRALTEWRTRREAS